jgi:hypothetical protein
MPVLADDQVVVHRNAERARDVDDRLGHLDVGARGRRISGRVVVQNQTRPGSTLISFNFFSSPGRQGTCIGGGNWCLFVLITCGLHRSRPKHFGARAVTNRPAVTDFARTFQGNSF